MKISKRQLVIPFILGSLLRLVVMFIIVYYAYKPELLKEQAKKTIPLALLLYTVGGVLLAAGTMGMSMKFLEE
jgi:hypothetical protein